MPFQNLGKFFEMSPSLQTAIPRLVSEYRCTPFSLQDGMSEWKGNGGLLIAKDVKLIGLLRMDNSRTHWGLSSFVIDSEFRGCGYGATMLAIANTVDKPVYLKVQQDNPAFHLYERSGFQTDCVSNGRYIMKSAHK